MNLLLLNGPTGTGKNTISEIMAKKKERCVVIDFDQLRNMIKNPHKAPWEGEEGYRQNLLHLKHACLLAKSFLDEGFDVIILDVLSNETAQLYKQNLSVYNPRLVLLLPTFEEIKKRNLSRPPRLTDAELEMVYQQQTKLTVYDEKIDNTYLSAEDVAERLL